MKGTDSRSHAAWAAALILSGCGATPVGKTHAVVPLARGFIDSAGGTLSARVGGVGIQVEVPPYALDAPVELTIGHVPSISGPVGPVFDLGPSGTHFARPVIVRMRSEELLAPYVLPPQLRVATRDEPDDAWSVVSSAAVDPGDHQSVAGLADHFSEFTLVESAPDEKRYVFDQRGYEFAVGDLTLSTSVSLYLHAMSIAPKRVDYLFQSDAPGTAHVAITGLRPGATVYLYDGSLANKHVLATSAGGVLAYEQPLTGSTQGIWLQLHESTLFVHPPDGGDCASVGTWHGSTNTCTLTSFVGGQSIELTSATLDCGSVETVGDIFLGGVAPGIQNCTHSFVQVSPGTSGGSLVNNFSVSGGILAFGPGANTRIEGNRYLNVSIALIATSGALVVNNGLGNAPTLIHVGSGASQNNVIMGNDLFTGLVGISLEDAGGGNVIEGNTIHAGFGGGTGLRVDAPGTQVIGNSIAGNSTGLILGDSTHGAIVRQNTINDNLRAIEFAFFTIPAGIRIFHNDIVGNGVPQLSASFNPALGPLEVSDTLPSSPTYKHGNYWGHDCPGPVFFDEAVDGTGQGHAVDSFPFGVPVAGGLPPFMTAPPCIDRDKDGVFEQVDCNDFASSCASDCSDSDADGLLDCQDHCLNVDRDNLGIDNRDSFVGTATVAVRDCTFNGMDACSPTGNFLACSSGVPDCDDEASSCSSDCTDIDGDGRPECRDLCFDVNGDGGGFDNGDLVMGDSVHSVSQCQAALSVACDLGPSCAFLSFCEDLDGDGYGVGPDCFGPDCDDTVAGCTVDCSADVDNDGLRDCDADPCVDLDGDGFGQNTAGRACPLDCDDTLALCDIDCSVDVDGDLVPDCGDTCVDVDNDGFGQPSPGQTCLLDCDDTSALCATDCSDLNFDTIFDCKQQCTSVEDPDGDGFGIGGCPALDCDESSPLCNTDCVTDVDNDGIPDCKDTCLDRDGDLFGVGPGCLGSDCNDSSSLCLQANCFDDSRDSDGTDECVENCPGAATGALCRPQDVCPPTAPPAIAGTCVDITVYDALTYYPISSCATGPVDVGGDIEFVIPAELPVTDGNAGNFWADLIYVDDQGNTVTCRYEGGSRVPHPESVFDVAAGQSYVLSFCTNGLGSGEVAVGNDFEIRIGLGDWSAGRTEVSLDIDNDHDDDGFCVGDNCPFHANDQIDTDGDGIGDVCECVPTCEGRFCGDSDRCGGTCTACEFPNATCEPIGCVCIADTCSSLGATCGTINDGCGNALNCGSCTPPDTCGGGGVPNQCGCASTTQCGDPGTECGGVLDNCGNAIGCGSCATGSCATSGYTWHISGTCSASRCDNRAPCPEYRGCPCTRPCDFMTVRIVCVPAADEPPQNDCVCQ